MLAGMETPRPLPPAKARRASALLKASSTPPPAYGSPFSLPSRRMQRQNILGSPMTSTFQMVGWDADPSDQQLPSPPPENEDPEWINERSREEIEELLTKADDIIKERENELGLASAVCKGLYQNNVALKSKHQAMVARIPVSPSRSNSSPENLPKMVLCNSNTNMASSTSDSALGLIKSPRQSFYRRHTRKVSIATADISLLEDQNAQLLEKLEKLEAEATSSDHAGRRELKRLEKEITFLREALEKTQAKSEELEEKVQGAVVGEAWRRKKEREAKFKAMRNLGRDSGGEESPVRNFAPEGSRYGGPSNTFSFFPTTESRDTEHQSVDGAPASAVDKTSNFLDPLSRPEHALISQLLVKVQELELTNARILQQQSETATQLSAVQRDTAHITKVYECLTDPNSTELQFEGDDHDEEEYRDPSSSNTIKFTSLKRDIETEMTYEGTCIVRPDFGASAGKNRKSVMGLFDDPAEDSLFSQSAHGDRDNQYDQESLWSEDPHSSTYSSNTTSRNLDLISPMPGALSPLHFFSPAPRIPSELSPINSRPTLQSELSKELGNDWEMNTNNHRIRSLSLYDLSQMSVPTSPSPVSRTMTMRLADELDTDEDTVLPLTPLLSSANSLRLSVEPPTPHRYEGSEHARNFMRDGRSPRMQIMSDTLRSRTNRWVDRRFQRSRSGWRVGDDDFDFDGHYQKDSEISRPPSPLDIGIPERLSHAVDSMIQGFDTFAGVSTSTDKPSLSRPATPPRDETSLLLHTSTTPKKKEEATNSGFLLQVWLWLQFAIVVFVFLYAMARRGPTAMLSEEQKRAVIRRR